MKFVIKLVKLSTYESLADNRTKLSNFFKSFEKECFVVSNSEIIDNRNSFHICFLSQLTLYLHKQVPTLPLII
jgi:hypothetical protein